MEQFRKRSRVSPYTLDNDLPAYYLIFGSEENELFVRDRYTSTNKWYSGFQYKINELFGKEILMKSRNKIIFQLRSSFQSQFLFYLNIHLIRVTYSLLRTMAISSLYFVVLPVISWRRELCLYLFVTMVFGSLLSLSSRPKLFAVLLGWNK